MIRLLITALLVCTSISAHAGIDTDSPEWRAEVRKSLSSMMLCQITKSKTPIPSFTLDAATGAIDVSIDGLNDSMLVTESTSYFFGLPAAKYLHTYFMNTDGNIYEQVTHLTQTTTPKKLGLEIRNSETQKSVYGFCLIM